MRVKKAERGIVLIELALYLPIFLALVGFIGSYCYWHYTKDSLKAAVVKGVKAGVIRGNADRMNAIDPTISREGLITTIEEFHRSSDWTPVSPLFHTRDIDPWDAQDAYNFWINSAFGGGTLQSMPTEALYALFFTLETLRTNLGRLVRFPCDPDSGYPTSNNDLCLKCEFMAYHELGCADGSGNPDSSICSFVPGLNIPSDRVGIRCTYRPWKPFTSLLALVGGSADLTFSTYYSQPIQRPGYG